MNIYQELYECQKSFSYFVCNYVKIKNYRKGEGAIPFSLYSYQEKIVDLIEENKAVAVIKFRQSGISTLTVAYSVWKMLFNQDQKIYMFSKTHREIRHLSEFVGIITENLPEWMPKLKKLSDFHYLSSTTQSPLFFRSIDDLKQIHNPTHFFIDEAAFIPYMEEKWILSIKPFVKNGTKVFVSSTPNGTENWFYDICSKNKEEIFEIYKPSYKEHPDYNNKEWIEEVRNNIGEEQWRQDVLGEFIEHQPALRNKSNYVQQLEKIKENLKLNGNETIDELIGKLIYLSTTTTEKTELTSETKRILKQHFGPELQEFSNSIT